MARNITERFERGILFGFGRYVANFSAVTGLALTLVGAVTVLESYPDKRLAGHPVDWLSKNTPTASLPDDYSAYSYTTRFPEKFSLKECFEKNSVGVAPEKDASKIPGWNASLFGESMHAFTENKINMQSNSSYSEYSLGAENNVADGIAEMARQICKATLASSTSTDPDQVFWETRRPVLLAASGYGEYFDSFNKLEDERKARLIPGAIILLTGVIIAFLASMSSSLYAIERNTRERANNSSQDQT